MFYLFLNYLYTNFESSNKETITLTFKHHNIMTTSQITAATKNNTFENANYIIELKSRVSIDLSLDEAVKRIMERQETLLIFEDGRQILFHLQEIKDMHNFVLNALLDGKLYTILSTLNIFSSLIPPL